MKITKGLEPLLQDGLIDKVSGQLMRGKESGVYVVRCHGQIRCGKGYIVVRPRSFHKQTQYTEGRMVRNTSRSRAMGQHSRSGRWEQETAVETNGPLSLDRSDQRFCPLFLSF